MRWVPPKPLSVCSWAHVPVPGHSRRARQVHQARRRVAAAYLRVGLRSLPPRRLLRRGVLWPGGVVRSDRPRADVQVRKSTCLQGTGNLPAARTDSSKWMRQRLLLEHLPAVSC